MEEQKALEFSIQFLDTAVLTYSAERFRRKSKETMLKMFAQLASSGLRSAKEVGMVHVGLLNKLNDEVKKMDLEDQVLIPRAEKVSKGGGDPLFKICVHNNS